MLHELAMAFAIATDRSTILKHINLCRQSAAHYHDGGAVGVARYCRQASDEVYLYSSKVKSPSARDTGYSVAAYLGMEAYAALADLGDTTEADTGMRDMRIFAKSIVKRGIASKTALETDRLIIKAADELIPRIEALDAAPEN
jgi:hypothetical protein